MRVITILISILLICQIAVADVPQTISYQGILSLNGGGLAEDGDYNLTFRLYTVASGGSQIWEENHLSTTVTEGRFNIVLGSQNSLTSLGFDQPYYLGISVNGGAELTPRVALTSSAYSLTAGGVVPSSITGESILNGSIGLEDLGQNSAAEGQVIKWSSGAWTLSSDETGLSSWTVSDSVTSTRNLLGIAKGGASNELYGTKSHTMVNLGVSCTTGVSSFNNINCTVGGGSQNAATHENCTVAGGYKNRAALDDASVGGGALNSATGFASTISGGRDNTASGSYSSVGGGLDNLASGTHATVAGGTENLASGDDATVSGGNSNQATGSCSFVSGGCNNKAAGANSFAGGSRASALHDGSFVWGDAIGGDLSSSQENQFIVRASGGIELYTDAMHEAGVFLPKGSSAWAIRSDRNLKHLFQELDGTEILDKLNSLEISEWSYKSEEPGIRHIGPVAQEFHRLFGTGSDSLTISTVDLSGVALAAIKQLITENKALKKEMEELRQMLQAQK